MSLKNVDAKTLKIWLDNNQAVLIDVREPAEYKAANIPGAKLIPLAQISKNNLPDFSGKKLVMQCHGGKRGGKACEKLLAEDPNLEIYNLEGGLSAWEQLGGEVKKSGKLFLPLDRQVQLTIGLGVLVGSLLGYFIDPLFFLLAGFFGAGLVFAGATGFCGLAILMAKMPWNRGHEDIVVSCSIKK